MVEILILHESQNFLDRARERVLTMCPMKTVNNVCHQKLSQKELPIQVNLFFRGALRPLQGSTSIPTY